MEKNKLNKESKDSILIVFAIIAVVFIIAVLFVTYYALHDLDPSERGTYGDMYGGANALFSGLAFVGIIITILLQRKELSLQREELVETRTELARTALAQERSERALTRQANNLKISAKLTALNSLVNYYADQELNANGDERYAIKIKKEAYVARIEQLLDLKENSITYNAGL